MLFTFLVILTLTVLYLVPRPTLVPSLGND